MLTRNPEGQEELIIQLWQKAICKLFEIQFRIHNKYVTKNKDFSIEGAVVPGHLLFSN